MKVLDGGRSVNAKIPNDIETNNLDTQDVKIMPGNDRSTNNVPILDEPSARTETFDNTRNDIGTRNIPDNNINVSDIPRLDEPNERTETFDNSNSENIHRLREDEYQDIPRSMSQAETRSSKEPYTLGPDEYKELPPHNEEPRRADTSRTTGTASGGGNNNPGNARGNNNSGSAGGNNNSGNAGGSNNPGSAGGNNNSENAGGNNNSGNAGGNNNPGNAGGNNNPGNTGANNNTNNTGTNNNTTNTQDSQGSNNQSSNNEEREPEKYEATTARKVIGGAETVVGRTAGVVGTAVSGVVDVATSTLSGDIGGAIESGVSTAIDSVNIATGSPSRSSSRSRTPSNSEKTTQSSKNLTSEAETVMKNANVSEAEAIALAEACKALKINDDRNMVLIAKVYKGADSADKNKVVELSKMLHRMKEEGKSKGDAEKALENQDVSTTTKELLIKMYKDLHI